MQRQPHFTRKQNIMTTWLKDPGRGADCAIIAEVAQAHDGSLGMAHAYIDAIAAAGATAVKFQTHIAAAESTPAEPWRARFTAQDRTRLDYWRRMEFTGEQWLGLKVHAEAKGLHFLSSPFSLEAFELLRNIGVAAWKIASGEIASSPLIHAIAATGLPVMLSTGMSEIEEIDRSVALIQSADCPLAVLQCTSLYPCPPEAVGLNMIKRFRDRYDSASGLSDHSGTIFAGLASATLGAEVIEVHVTLSREMFGPDVCASITTSELRQLVNGVDFIERARLQPVDKGTVPEAVTPLRDIFMKSVVARTNLHSGVILTAEELAFKKPAGGLPPARMHELIGRRLRRDIPQDQMIHMNDVEQRHEA
jgi:N,N'-diacetyllegionaminate synthase